MHDFVAIGDIVTDVFIRLTDPRIYAEIRDGKYELSIPFAEKVPFEEAYIVPAVGNAGNAAASATTLGLNTALVSNIGNDKTGEECLEAIKKRGIKTDFINIEAGKKTNYHYVLWFKDDRTILVKHEEFNYKMPDIGSPKWIYFSSINGKAYPFHNEIAEYLENHPEIKFAFQPGKFEIQLGKEKLERIYKRADIFFVNLEEARTVLADTNSRIEELLEKIRALGPKIVVITDGPKGLYAYDGETKFYIPAYPDPKPPYERTGAGDALASTTVSAMALGKPLEVALLWGLVNSMSVVQEVGAQKGLLTHSQIEEYLKKPPADFKPKKI